MINPKNLIFLILMLLWACNSSNSQGDQYSYDEMVEIYAVSHHLSNQEEIRSRLKGPLDIESQRYQVKYGRSFKSLAHSRKRWNQFIKHTVEFYIQMQKEGKNTVTKYYKIKAYEANSNRFNENDLIDLKGNPLPPNYWKVVFIQLKHSGRVVFSRERYSNNRMTLRVYYNMRNRFKVKEERLMSGSMQVTYFYFNKKLKEEVK